MPEAPNRNWGLQVNVCSAVSYFSNRVVSIIGAGRLSFRVRDGSGRFPAAVAAVTLFNWAPCFWWWGVGVVRGCVVADACGVTRLFNNGGFLLPVLLGVCKFSAG
jgi:hypothetical protein